jgi:class 3 adenylate cyclase
MPPFARGCKLSPVVEPGDVRIGDDDRQRVIDALSRHTGEGRLTLDEFAELVGRVYAARTRRDLDEVVAGLPDAVNVRRPATAVDAAAGGMAAGDTAAGDPAARPAAADGANASPEATPSAPRRRFVAIMSGTAARGRWRAPDTITAFAFWGHVKVDLRQALIDERVVEVTAWAIMGSVEVVVPDGIPVELDGMVVMGGSSDDTQRSKVAPLPHAPLIRVHARGLWGGVTARTSRRRSRSSGHKHRHTRDRDLVSGYLDGHIDDIRESAREALRSLQTSLPPPPAPGPAFARHRERAGRSDRDRWWEPPSPPAPGTPLDLRDYLPRFLTEERRPDPDERTNGQTASAPPADDSRLPQGTLTILVTDMVGSTELAERLGDQKWWEILQAHNAFVRAQIEGHGGVEVKAQGDGFLAVFASARQAILAALAIQRAAARHSAENPPQRIDLRIGLHTGETVESDGDVFGQNVILAVRIADAAGPGDVLVSGLTHDLTAAAGDLRFGPGEEVSLKGFSVPWRVHRVAWA